jgi:LysR family glycine cleavage system transcriptional activator
MKKLRRHIPSLNALFAFEAAGRLKSFSRASEELNVTPAAVSRMMRRLEDHLDTALFQRDGSGVALSGNGLLLHEATSRAMTQIETALTEIEQSDRTQDTVTLSLSTAFTTHWLIPRMARFKAAFPTVNLRFQLLMGAVSGPVDDVNLGMRFLTAPVPGHSVFPIMPEVVLPVSSPSYRRRPVDDGVTWMRLSEGEARPADGNLSDPALNGAASLFFTDYAIAVQAALLGQGVCWGWINVIGHWMREGQLIPFAPRLQVSERACCLLQRRGRGQNPVVDLVRDWLIAELRADYTALLGQYPQLALPELVVPAWTETPDL